MTYQLCKQLIENGKTVGLQGKLDVFLLANRLTDEEYQELSEVLKQEA